MKIYRWIMNTQRKIFNSLKKNSSNEYVANFLQNIFIEENSGLNKWKDKYDELIDEYYEGYLDED